MKDYQVNIFSQAMNRPVPVRILEPEGENAKCLILLHGYGGDQNQWCNRSKIRDLAEQYYVAVLMPGCGDGYYEDTVEDMPRFVGEELIRYARTQLPVSRDKDAMSIAGVSMGGFGALLVGAKYPHQFGRIASLSGAFIIPDVVIGNQGVLGPANPYYFKAVFGDFESLEGSARDPFALAISAADAHVLPEVFLLCGTRDVLYRENRKIATTLREHHGRVIWLEPEGGHTWELWNGHLEAMMVWLAK